MIPHSLLWHKLFPLNIHAFHSTCSAGSSVFPGERPLFPLVLTSCLLISIICAHRILNSLEPMTWLLSKFYSHEGMGWMGKTNPTTMNAQARKPQSNVGSRYISVCPQPSMTHLESWGVLIGAQILNCFWVHPEHTCSFVNPAEIQKR